ncbi:GntR family transcriptional regulator [Hoeflea sp. BAL378]|uniref:FadR/GntR family transcriptional regulator n=1 Tax=Hoeflea sp. BAL378 TaxID=1547437 RepID=UPI000513D723|nr:FadR/GntR family transcriptional regulator [Hoeflea sp. BAL378]KGF70043.1 GntR family transcriptional regulator [Hoeflea sp. BAL378]
MKNTESEFLPGLVAYIVKTASANGDKAPSERELAEHFAVSRGQVRESLAILEALQLIERRAKSGIYLTMDSAGLSSMALLARAGVQLLPRQIFEAVELRKIHEIKAAELAAQRATEENLDRLRDILARSEKQIADGLGLHRLDGEFHLEIVRATQNEMFYKICSSFYAASEQRLPIYFGKAERNIKSHNEHMQIFDALYRRDSILAQALMNTHLGRAQSYWTEILDSNGEKAAQPDHLPPAHA